MNTLYLVTSNPNKLTEWRAILPTSITIDTANIDLPEIQSTNLQEIVADKARRAFEVTGKPVVVEDIAAGLEKLGGLPGPFVKFFMKQMGNDALYKLAGSEGERAIVSCAAAFFDGNELITSQGDLHGVIVAPRGNSGFGFDVTFIPDGEDETLAEMDAAKKNSLSHRRKAVQLLSEKLGKKL